METSQLEGNAEWVCGERIDQIPFWTLIAKNGQQKISKKSKKKNKKNLVFLVLICEIEIRWTKRDKNNNNNNIKIYTEHWENCTYARIKRQHFGIGVYRVYCGKIEGLSMRFKYSNQWLCMCNNRKEYKIKSKEEKKDKAYFGNKRNHIKYIQVKKK